MKTAGARRPASPGVMPHRMSARTSDFAYSFRRYVRSLVLTLIRCGTAVGRPRALVSVSLCLCGVLILGTGASAQTINGFANRKQATATRVPNGSIRVDGRLDEEIWLKAAP